MSISNPSRSVKKWTLGAIQGAGNLTDQSILGFNPYTQGGNTAYETYLGSLGLGGQGGYERALSSFRTSPGYDFRMDQGTQAVDRSAASRGMLGSGATLKALTQYGQGLADQEYGNWQNQLAGVANTGLQALGQQASLRDNQASRLFQGYSNIGNAQAQQSAGYLGALGQIGGALIGNIGGSFGNALGRAWGGMGGAGGGYKPFFSGSGGLW